MTINRLVISPTLPLIMEDFNLTYAEAGFFVGTFFYGYMAMQIPAGLIGDRIGNKKVLLIGTYVWSIFALFTGLARSAVQLFSLRVGMALGQGSYFSNDRALISTSAPKEATGLSHGLSFLGTGIGYSLGILLGGFLAESVGWRYTFIALALPGFIVGLLLWKGIHSPQRKSPSRISGGLRRSLLNRDLWILSIASMILNYSFWVLLVWSPTILVEQGSVQLSFAAVLASGAGFASVPGLLLFGFLGDYSAKKGKGRKLVILVGFVGVSLMMTLLGLELQTGRQLSLMVVYLFLAAFFNWGLWPSIFAMAGKMAPEEHQSLNFGILNTVTFVSAVIAPWATGIVRDLTGVFSPALYVTAVVTAVGVLFTMLMRPALRFSNN